MEFFLDLLDPAELERLIFSWGWLGYPILFGIVFAETGLLVGFFFPGDSLLFLAGFAAGQGVFEIGWLNLLLMAAAISGDAVGYHLGRRTGPAIFRREESFFFKKRRLEQAHAFYEKHGGKTIVLARFMPFLRTFAPFVAGLGTMSYPRFAAYNVFGGIGWVASMTLAGYFFGNIPIVKRNLETVVVLIILASVSPLVWEAAKAYVRRRRAPVRLPGGAVSVECADKGDSQ